ncbi:Alpha/Beta hydrolase protein [Trichoderma austrokoningii]
MKYNMSSPLSAHEVGEGFPVLIVHGWQGEGKVEELDFEPIFVEAPGFLRIYVDLPGMGSTPGDSIQSLDEIYLRLANFIDSRLQKSRFALIGTSIGGYLARALAQKYHGQVDGLVLRVPVIEPQYSKRDLDPYSSLVENKELMSTMSNEDKKLLGDVIVQTPIYIQTLRAKIIKIHLPAEKAADKTILDPIRDDPQRYRLSIALIDEDTKFFAPTLVICGRQDGVVGYRDSLRLLELYPRSTFAILDRGTHGLPIDETGVFKGLVRDWIFRVNEWRGRAD